MKRLLATMLFAAVFGATTQAQGLFEQAVSGGLPDGDNSAAASLGAAGFELNGTLRGVSYVGKVPDQDAAETKAAYGELALSLRARKGELGDAFGEFRVRRGLIDGRIAEEIDVREAYVDAYLGPLDLRIGEQIIVWGRADGINPTNNLTPQDLRTRSPNEDDRRSPNFAVRATVNATPIRVEGVWVPFYAPAHFPTLNLPRGIVFEAPNVPSADLENGIGAVRLQLEEARFDVSVSYLRGYALFPGIALREVRFVTHDVPELHVAFAAYRHEVFGADFSTTLGSWGLRGEAAYTRPFESGTRDDVPLADLEYVLGIDREIFGVSVIAQYVGRYVPDWKALEEPPRTMPPTPQVFALQIAKQNRMLNGQLDRVTHSAMFRLQKSALHETLSMELMALFNVTTKERLLVPKVSYDLADALTATLGAELYGGPEDTLFGTIDESRSALFVELKASF